MLYLWNDQMMPASTDEYEHATTVPYHAKNIAAASFTI